MRQLTDSDWPAFCDFAERSFGMAHNRDLGFNQHWFKTSFYDGWSAMVIDRPNGDIAGVMMLIVTPAWFNGRVLPMAWISTGVVDVDLRGRAGAQLFMWAYRTFPLVGALSGNSFSTPINNVLGKTIPDVAIRRFVMMHNKRALDLCRPSDRASLAEMSFAAPAAQTHLRGFWSSKFPDDYDALWHRTRDGFFWTTARTAAHRSWRFIEAPFITYRILEIRDGAALRAVAVVRRQETPAGTVCRIVDFLAEPAYAAGAWRVIASQLSGDDTIMSDFFVIGTAFDESLTAAGFKFVKEDGPLAALPHLLSPVEHRRWSNTVHFGGKATSETEDWRRSDAIYFTKADSDRDWPTPFDLDQLARETEARIAR